MGKRVSGTKGKPSKNKGKARRRAKQGRQSYAEALRAAMDRAATPPPPQPPERMTWLGRARQLAGRVRGALRGG
jgi:hypothetical protein